MIANYLKIAVRNLLKQKGLATINIFGLSIGLACFSLFLLYAVNEFSYDRFHTKADNLYRVYRWAKAHNDQAEEKDTYLPMPLGKAMKADFPDFVNVVRMREDWGDEFIRIDGIVGRKGLAFVDPNFLKCSIFL